MRTSQLLLATDLKTREYALASIQKIEAIGTPQTFHLVCNHPKTSELAMTPSSEVDTEKARINMAKRDMIATFIVISPAMTWSTLVRTMLQPSLAISEEASWVTPMRKVQ